MLDAEYHELKDSLHSKVINEIDLESLNRLKEDTAREQLRRVILEVLQREKTPLTLHEREQMVIEILDEVFGLGPLQPLLGDHTLSEEKMSASSYLSQNDPRLHFGLGRRTLVDEVTIRWLSGKVQKLKNLKANQLVTVVEQ